MDNSFISFSTRRPVLTTVLYIIVIIIGLVSLWRLPIDLMPEITFPRITVVTSYGNAGPQEVEELVTKPVESSLAGVQGIEEITSTSSEGRSAVRVSFTWGTNLDEATNDIRDRIDRIMGRLPDDVERPSIRKFDLSASPIMVVGAVSDLDHATLRNLIEDQVQYRLERIDGVASVDIRGGDRREISVSLRTDALKALNISPDMVVATLRQENRNIPGGSIRQGNKEITVRTVAQYGTLDEIRDAVIAIRNGVPVTIGEVAEINDALEEITSIVRIGGKPGIQLSVSKQSGVNTVAVAKVVKRELEAINRDIPQLRLIPLMDSSKFIGQAIGSMGNALVMGGIFSILILLLFLRNISSTVIIATTIPIAIIATFALMYFGGLTLNLMTFGGLALGIGMLVDNAIVVLDNIFHHRERGGTAPECAVSGAREVYTAVVASTLTTLVVFFPVVFIRGMSGILFRQLAIVVSFALVCSLVSALTLIPMLSSRFLHLPRSDGMRRTWLTILFERSERVYASLEQRYGTLLRWALGHRKVVVIVCAALFALSVLIIPIIGVELMPATDEGEVRVNAEMEIGTRLELMDSAFTKIETIAAREIPEAQFILANIGGGGWGSSGGHSASMRISLVQKNQRSRSSAEIADALRRRLTGIPGVVIRVREGQGMFMFRMGSGQGQSIDVEIRGHDLAAGQRLAEAIEKQVSAIKGVTDVRISRQAGMPEYVLHIDRKKASDLGLTPLQIGTVVQTAISGSQASTLLRGGSEFPIMVRLSPDERKSMERLAQLTIINKTGSAIPLAAVARIEAGSGPIEIERHDRERIITVEVSYSDRDLGSVVRDIRTAVHAVSTPPDFAVLIRGDYEEQQKSFRELMVGLLLAIVLVYLVMAAQFESFKDPFIVLFSIPMALIGVVAILLLTGTPFSIQAFIGCIILAGIVVNNAIVLIDYTNRLRREHGQDLYTAILSAGVRRLRPIMMTASTTILGLLPLSLALGEGGESQAPMARVVIGGLLVSALITLVLIPVIYSLVEDRFKNRGKHKEPHPVSNPGVKPAGFVLFLFGAVYALLFPAGAHAADTVRLSLQRALERAVHDNRLVRIERIDVDIARTVLRENKYRYEPSVGASLSRTGTLSNKDTSDASYQGSVQISEYLPLGATLGMKGTVGQAGKASAAASGSPKNGYQRTMELSVTAALLQNAGVRTNLVPLRKASLDVAIRQEELAGYAQRVVADVELAYWDLYLAGRELQIHTQSLELSDRLLFESQERLKAGKIAPLDLAVVNAEVASRKKNYIGVQADFMKKRLRLLHLVNDTGSSYDTPVALIDHPPTPQQPDSLELHLRAALRYRPDLIAAQSLARKGELDVVQTRNGLLPKLDVFITLAGTAYSESFGGAATSGSDRSYVLSGGVTLSLPFTNGAARERHQRAVLSKRQTELSLENLSRLIRLDVRSAWIEAERVHLQIGAATTARQLQEDKLAAEQLKLAAGKSTEYLLLQAQRDLTAALLDEARMEVAYVNAVTDLYVKDGTLLERRGVDSRGIE